MDFTSGIAAFTAALRDEHRFGVGHAATRDALRAAEIIGVTDASHLRRAFRTIYCATPDEAARFNAAFDAFFLSPHGITQPNLTSRHTRPRPERAAHDRDERSANQRTPQSTRERDRDTEDSDEHASRVAERRPVDDANDPATVWQTLRARYSAAAARAPAPPIPAAGMDAMLAHASRLIAGVRIARSRRRTPRRTGDRIDLRRTLRASVETAGDPIDLRRTARTLRSARFVVLIDGSRSTAEHAGPMLQFAYALVQRSRRANAFVFSTALRDITRTLRENDVARTPRGEHRAERPLGDLGEAWGGGTRIGDNLLAFVREHGARLLSPQTLVFIFSDGLDVGHLDRLERALRELRARSAGIVWLHPHANARAFEPSARGMRTALPYIAALHPAREEADFGDLARMLGRGAISR
ncbi:MAG: uncharacterized protein QOJ39_1953 [Candidatus Eremiobacteraeota bacterium]|nr:uncharacterized protein [Candidatus Eremiobacteraeota bacterium]